MSDMLEQPDATSGGIDRRSAIKKAAVAGAVAWTAPVVLSSQVAAGNGFCTPKCDPETAPAVVSGCAWCIDKNSKVPSIVFGTIGSGGCGACGGTSTNAFSLEEPFLFDKVPTGGTTLTASLLSGNRLVVLPQGGGAVGNGVYVSVGGGLVVTSTCTDRNGDKVVLSCTYGISFDYQPRDGACSQQVPFVAGCTADTGVIKDFGYTLLGTCRRTCNGKTQPKPS